MERQKKSSTIILVLYGIIAVLVLIFIFQNRAPIEINLLGIKLVGRTFIIFMALLGIGFFAGWLFEYLRQLRKAGKVGDKPTGTNGLSNH